uniref:Protein kinase domain-containing protein n=1 Tax=viral metagenome TaxID=1070528 RepID=A0A6C0B925_9ZZZZ
MEPRIHYEKRKNGDLFKQMQKKDGLHLSNVQNYIPIYNKFFSLNETNYNSVNLNHNYYIQNIIKKDHDTKDIYTCEIRNTKLPEDTEKKRVFFKMAPLLDPFKYFIGKYNINDPELFTLPKYNSVQGDTHPKLLDANNASYVDGLFVYLSSMLLHRAGFVHGLDYYGSFLSIKNNFAIDVIDDVEYLDRSDFFKQHKNSLFHVEDYQFLLESNDVNMKKPLLIIDKHHSSKSTLSIQSINDELYEDLFLQNHESAMESNTIVTLQDMKDMSLEIPDIMVNEDIHHKTTIKTNSTCSSRTSHTSDDEKPNTNSNTNTNEDDDTEDEDGDEEEDTGKESNDSDENTSLEEEKVEAVISKFPIEVICMECCDETFDTLLANRDNLPETEWFSALMQIIMILLTYQKVFSFTHNDLHTNNIMYNKTNKKYLYYCYKKTYYRVPTFGRIFKIIDFGRSIYKCNDKLFCSDSFQPGADAATQYNTEPYFDEKKPRLEPNYSFDLCRLACSLFDYVVEDIEDVSPQNIANCSPIVKLVNDWCLDDNGINIMYKNNGAERYPDFKLYKMIARLVHKHTPQSQLERKEFAKYIITKQQMDKKESIMDIDSYII